MVHAPRSPRSAASNGALNPMGRRRSSLTSLRLARITAGHLSASRSTARWPCCRCRTGAARWYGAMRRIGPMRFSHGPTNVLFRAAKAFGWRLGRITHAGKRVAYPLALTTASQTVSHRVATVGNAAQTLHPIAGQGFNLGLRDVISPGRATGPDVERTTGLWRILGAKPLPETTPGRTKRRPLASPTV